MAATMMELLRALYRETGEVGIWFEPPHDKSIKMICAPSEDSDQSGHLPSLI